MDAVAGGAAPSASVVPQSPPWSPVPTPGALAAAAPKPAEEMPDQIAPRRAISADDRPPSPVVYQPVSSSYVGEVRPPFPEAAPRNVPALASVVLIVLAVAGGIAVVVWLAAWDAATAGMVGLVSVALAVGAFFLAVGGLIIAAQRRTRRVLPVVALVGSLIAAVWLGALMVEQALAILD